jgi:hypothetical protein
MNKIESSTKDLDKDREKPLKAAAFAEFKKSWA